jgi:Flp pilus assembly protein TadD
MRFALVSLALLLLATGAAANPDDDASAPAQPAAVTADSHFNQGQALARQSDWAGAEQAYREATRLRSAFPEAWNGLGHALRKRGKLEESVKAYQEALRLRPQYPQALEYLGEAYVQMGRLDEARGLLRRLQALDPKEAGELAEMIDGGGRASGRW